MPCYDVASSWSAQPGADAVAAASAAADNVSMSNQDPTFSFIRSSAPPPDASQHFGYAEYGHSNDHSIANIHPSVESTPRLHQRSFATGDLLPTSVAPDLQGHVTPNQSQSQQQQSHTRSTSCINDGDFGQTLLSHRAPRQQPSPVPSLISGVDIGSSYAVADHDPPRSSLDSTTNDEIEWDNSSRAASQVSDSQNLVITGSETLSSADRRKRQNRAAQRAFRERKEQYVQSLERKLRFYQQDNERLRRLVTQSESKLHTLQRSFDEQSIRDRPLKLEQVPSWEFNASPSTAFVPAVSSGSVSQPQQQYPCDPQPCWSTPPPNRAQLAHHSELSLLSPPQSVVMPMGKGQQTTDYDMKMEPRGQPEEQDFWQGHTPGITMQSGGMRNPESLMTPTTSGWIDHVASMTF